MQHLLSKFRLFFNHFFVGIILTFILSGCHSTQLQPIQLSSAAINTLIPEDFPTFDSIEVLDLRAQQHALRLHVGNQPAQFSTVHPSLSQAIKTKLSKSVPQTHKQTSVQLDIKIYEGLCIVQQQALSYAETCQAKLSITAQQVATENSQAWQKTYRAKRERVGKLTLNKKDMVNDFDQVIQAALAQFLNDTQFINWYHAQAESITHAKEPFNAL